METTNDKLVTYFGKPMQKVRDAAVEMGIIKQPESMKNTLSEKERMGEYVNDLAKLIASAVGIPVRFLETPKPDPRPTPCPPDLR